MADWQERGVLRQRGRARPLGAAPGLHRPRRRERRRAPASSAACAWRTTARADPPPRAHPSRAQGGPPQPDARHAGQPLPIFAFSRPRPGRGERWRRSRWRAVRRGEGRHGNRSGESTDPDPSPRSSGAGRRRAADRRRPPPLRDRADLRRRDRRRGRAPLRADVPLLAAGPRPAIFPTHRLLTGLKDHAAKQQGARREGESFEIEESTTAELEPAAGWRRVAAGLHGRPPPAGRYRLTLKDQAIADRAMPACPSLPAPRHRGAGVHDPARRARYDRRRYLAQAGTGYSKTSRTPSTP